jgi:hypothetical protein
VEQNDKFKWTEQDNEIAQIELQMATLLTVRLSERPELSLDGMMQSQKIRAELNPYIIKISEILKTEKINILSKVYIEPGKGRVVFVMVEDETN